MTAILILNPYAGRWKALKYQFEVEKALKDVGMVRLRGIIQYLVAALRAIMDKRTWNIQLEWDTGNDTGLVSLVTLGNNPITVGPF